tara:strand:+ start:8806 stop:10188 length:1383 start_codon:yes stop_codon:yes gene_type:complete
MKKLYLMYFYITIFFVIFFNGCVENKKVSESSPNIIFIFTDDLGYGDLGIFGAEDIKTPHIDFIGKNGIKFTDFYSVSSVCTPSRAGLLTGRMPQRFGLNGVLFPDSHTGMPSSEYTIAELLNDNGYTTGIVGKWHLGHKHEYLPLQQGFDSFFGIPYSNDMASTVYMRGNDIVDHFPNQSLMTNKLTEESIDFIEKNKNNKFFLYLAHPMPHVPIYASEKFIGSSERGLYGDVIQEIDWSVGRIINKLKENNLLNNTLVIFSSDNGPWLTMGEFGGSSGKLSNGKMYTFEGGMRVPTLAMYIDYIPAGSQTNQIMSQLDWFPTFARLTNSEFSDKIILDGEDISAVLRGESDNNERDFLFFDYDKLEAYRLGDYKVKLPYEGWPGTWYKSPLDSHDTLLFNLSIDPGEKNNIFESNKELALILIEKMKKKYSSMGDLPPSIIIRTDADESHLDYLNIKK